MTPPISEIVYFTGSLLLPRPTHRGLSTYVILYISYVDTNRVKIGRLISLICLLIKKLCYLLIFVDTFTGWIKAFLACREMADVVTQVLLDNIIAQFGIPQTIQIYNGPSFTSRVRHLVSGALNIS